MSEDPRRVAVAKASRDLGDPFHDFEHEQEAERFIAMYDALRLQQGEEVRQHQSRDRSTLEPGDNATAPAAPVTAGAEPQLGWYVVLRNGRAVDCIHRISKGWRRLGEELTEEWPYMVFTLGPRVDDLLRDAAEAKRLREIVNTIVPMAGCFDPDNEEQVEEIGLEWSKRYHVAKRDAARVKQMERALGAAKDFIVLEELAPAEHVFEIHKRAEVRAKIYALIDAEIAREEK